LRFRKERGRVRERGKEKIREKNIKETEEIKRKGRKENDGKGKKQKQISKSMILMIEKFIKMIKF